MSKRAWVFVITLFLANLTVSADPWLGDARILAADQGYQWEAAVAYNSVHDEYLAVWTTDAAGVEEVYGIRVDSEGVPIGSYFAISEPGYNQWDPAVAYDPVNDRYLVTWTFDYSGNGTDTDIRGRFIPWDGPSQTYRAFGVEVALSNQKNSAIAYNPINLEFLIVWDDHEDGFPFQILGQLLAADGSTATSALGIANGPLGCYRPRVAWNRETQQYLVVYQQDGTGNQTDIYGTLLTATGSPVAPAIGIAGWPGGEYDPDLASCRGSFLVVWVGVLPGESDDDTEIFTRAVSGDGIVGSIVTDLPGDYLNERQAAVACNRSGNQYLVSWYAQFTDSLNYGVLGAFVNLDASPQTGTFAVFAPTVGNNLDYQYPGIAFNGADRALVAWEADRPPDGTFVDIAGRLVGGRLFADGFESGAETYWAGDN